MIIICFEKTVHVLFINKKLKGIKMKLLVTIQYPYAVIEIPEKVDKSVSEIKNELNKWLNDDISESVVNCDWEGGTDSVFNEIIHWLEENLNCKNEIKVIKKGSNIDSSKFSKSQTIFI